MKRFALVVLLGIAALPGVAPGQTKPSAGISSEGPVTSLPPAKGASDQGDSAPPPPKVIASEPGESCHRCRVTIFGEYLYWNVHGADVPFAQAFDGIDPVFSVPRGPIGVVSPQFQSGFRVGGAVDLSDSQWVTGAFTYFRTERNASIAATDGLVLHNFLAFPNTANAAVDSLTSRADYAIQLMVADLDYRCAIVHNDHLLLKWLAGVRYANLEQNLSSTFQVTGETTLDSRINFDGFGPRIGLEGQYYIHGGFYGYATGIFDLLFGQFRGSYEQRNVFTGLVGQTSIISNRAVPILELEIGAGWQSEDGRFRLSGGYYVGSWCNALTTTSLANAIGNVNFTTNGNNFRDNIVFDGLVLRGEFRF